MMPIPSTYNYLTDPSRSRYLKLFGKLKVQYDVTRGTSSSVDYSGFDISISPRDFIDVLIDLHKYHLALGDGKANYYQQLLWFEVYMAGYRMGRTNDREHQDRARMDFIRIMSALGVGF